MKRLLLLTINLLFLMALAASHSAPQQHVLTALEAQELDGVTAGICTTCEKEKEHPYIEYEGWDLIKRSQSTHTVISRKVTRQLVNNSPSATTSYDIPYNNQCRYRWTGGSASIGTSIGITFNRVYDCSEVEYMKVTLPPKTSATLYEGTKRYYVTETYRHYMQWSDGYREVSGLTETFRQEFTYFFHETN